MMHDISQCILGRRHHFNGQEFLNVYRDKQTHEKMDRDKVDLHRFATLRKNSKMGGIDSAHYKGL